MLKSAHYRRTLLRRLTDAIANLESCHSHAIRYELDDPKFTEEIRKIEKKLLALREDAKKFPIQEEPLKETTLKKKEIK